MKIGIIGAGKISEKHILAYQTLGYESIMIFDVDSSLTSRIAGGFGVSKKNTLSELFDSADVVDICTPVNTHKAIIMQALECGKHIFCEKPLCQTLSEAYEIKEAAEKAGNIVMVGYLYRFYPCFQQVKKWIDAGIIGTIHFGLFRIGGRGNHKKWKHLKEAGGGCINEMLIHKLDLVHFFFDKIDNVKLLNSEIIIKERVIDGERFQANAEDNVLLKLGANNATIICQADFTSPSYMEYLELHGEQGSIFTSILNYFPTLLYLNKPYGIYNQGNNFIHKEQVNLFELELRHFLTCVEKKQDNTHSIDNSIELMKIVEAIRTPGGNNND